MNIFLTLILSLLFLACENHPEKDHANPEKIVIDEIPADIMVPVQMWDDVETDQVGLGEKKIERPDDDSGMNRNTILFSPVTVLLKEHNSDVLNIHKFESSFLVAEEKLICQNIWATGRVAFLCSLSGLNGSSLVNCEVFMSAGLEKENWMGKFTEWVATST